MVCNRFRKLSQRNPSKGKRKRKAEKRTPLANRLHQLRNYSIPSSRPISPRHFPTLSWSGFHFIFSLYRWRPLSESTDPPIDRSTCTSIYVLDFVATAPIVCLCFMHTTHGYMCSVCPVCLVFVSSSDDSVRCAPACKRNIFLFFFFFFLTSSSNLFNAHKLTSTDCRLPSVDKWRKSQWKSEQSMHADTHTHTHTGIYTRRCARERAQLKNPTELPSRNTRRETISAPRTGRAMA